MTLVEMTHVTMTLLTAPFISMTHITMTLLTATFIAMTHIAMTLCNYHKRNKLQVEAVFDLFEQISVDM